MASGLAVVIMVLLTFATETTLGTTSKCHMTLLTDGWTSVECQGQDSEKQLTKLLSQPVVTNTSRLSLVMNSVPQQNPLLFNRFINITHLRIQTIDLSKIISCFKGFNKLKHLNLSSNHIRTLTNLTIFETLEDLDLSNNSLYQVDFSLIPSTIKTIHLRSNSIQMELNVTLPKGLKHLDLSNNHMNRVQPILSEDLTQLNLRENNISNLTFILSIFSTEELDLSINNITEIEDETFSTLSSLIRLDLSRNFIKSLKEKSFSGLNRLQIIDLSRNLLQSITPGTFQYLSNLLWLNLANNTDLGNLDAVEDSSILLGAGQKLQTVDASRTNLTKVPNTLTRSIRNLYLSTNRISTIRCGDLDSFLLLQFLDLASNNISVVEDDAFGRLELLYYLLLAENSLESIPHSLPDNLRVLDLDHNHIQNLTINDFFGLSKLRTLRLAWNRIRIVQDGAFGQLSSLQNLDLSGNPIKILSGSTFVGPRRLINLSLSSLTNILPTNDTLSFPVPESSHLQILNLENSAALVVQLMNDIAALSMFRHINILNLAFSKTQSLRPDLVNFFPRLAVLDLRGNMFNCSDVIWLSNWLRRLQQEPSEETKLQQLEENVKSPDNHTDFDIAQYIKTYTNRLKMAPKEDDPKCSSPDHLAGVSLYELRGPTPTTTQSSPLHLPRYDRTNISINQHDHEFYQNDFPSAIGEQKVRPETTTARTKPPEGNKRPTKRGNITDNVSLRFAVSQTNKAYSNKTIKARTEHVTNIVKILNNQTVSRDNIKAEYLRSEDKLNSIRNQTANNVETTTVIISTKIDTDISKLVKHFDSNKPISIYSPLDVTMQEMNNEKSSKDDLDNTLSISSPQKISVEDDSDVAKDLTDDDDEDVNEERYTHHPGLLLFFVAAGVLGATALAMKASQRRQSRHGYAQQQDIEVRSLDLSAHELW